MIPQSWVGQTIGGRYQIETLIGQGGMSAVYRGVDPNLRRVVAIKLIHPHLSVNPDFVERFKEEAAAVASLRHPNIVQVHDFNNDGQTYYMVMEYLAGETLQARLKRLNAAQRHLTLDETLRFSAQICEAASYAHQRGLIHRDIKPANVMLDIHGQAILMDFGIVKIVGGQYHTSTGATVGTAMYMSPEQIRGERIDERSDIYSLGVMLFEMISGRPPYEADSALTVMMMHINDPVPDLREIRPEMPDELRQVIESALTKERGDRFQTASEMALALRRLQASLDSATIATRPDEKLAPQSDEQPVTYLAGEETVKAASTQPAELEQVGTLEAPAGVGRAEPAMPASQSQQPQDVVPPAVKSRRRIPRRAWLAGIGLGVVILAAIAVILVLNSRKLPAVQLVPVASPAVAIDAENVGAVVPLATWEIDSVAKELDYSPDGSMLATANDRDWVRYSQYRFYGGLWQVEPGTLQAYLRDHTQWMNGVAFSPDGQLVATAAEDSYLNLWQASDGSLVRKQESPSGGVTSVDFSPNGKLLASGAWDGTVSLWQVSNGNLLRTLKDEEVAIYEVEFSPDGALLAAAGDDGAIRIWQVSDASLLYTLTGHSDKVHGINFSPDGSLLASASEDQTIGIWQIDDGSRLHTLEGHSGPVMEVAFSPDGALLASGSGDYTLRLWQVSDGNPLRLLEGFEDTVLSLDFSPDGQLLASSSGGGMIRFWGVSEALTEEP